MFCLTLVENGEEVFFSLFFFSFFFFFRYCGSAVDFCLTTQNTVCCSVPSVPGSHIEVTKYDLENYSCLVTHGSRAFAIGIEKMVNCL